MRGCGVKQEETRSCGAENVDPVVPGHGCPDAEMLEGGFIAVSLEIAQDGSSPWIKRWIRSDETEAPREIRTCNEGGEVKLAENVSNEFYRKGLEEHGERRES